MKPKINLGFICYFLQDLGTAQKILNVSENIKCIFKNIVINFENYKKYKSKKGGILKNEKTKCKRNYINSISNNNNSITNFSSG